MKNYYVAAGFNSNGILGSSGAGRLLSEWIVHGYTHIDAWPSHISRLVHQLDHCSVTIPIRFGDHSVNKNFLYQRAIEIVGRRYQLAYPKMEYSKARNIKYGRNFP